MSSDMRSVPGLKMCGYNKSSFI